MDKFSLEQARIILVSMFSPILGYLTPTKGFIISLVIMFAVNIFAGMRADGISIVRCKNFSFRKFKNALFEFLLYLLILETMYSVLQQCGDGSAAIVAAKSLTYVFIYVYAQNALKNLIYAYPNIIAIRLLYHVIRLEFRRALPSHIKQIVDRMEQDMAEREKRSENKKEDANTENKK